eukprot:gene59815-79779_t
MSVKPRTATPKAAAKTVSKTAAKVSPGTAKDPREDGFRAFQLPADHPGFVTGGRVMGGKIGVLFLSAKRVIDWPAALWQPILQGIILSIRPGKKGKDYASIWNTEKNEGPLLTITRSQAEKLAEELAPHSERVIVDFAMRY